jgi:hypothetical protein
VRQPCWHGGEAPAHAALPAQRPVRLRCPRSPWAPRRWRQRGRPAPQRRVRAPRFVGQARWTHITGGLLLRSRLLSGFLTRVLVGCAIDLRFLLGVLRPAGTPPRSSELSCLRASERLPGATHTLPMASRSRCLSSLRCDSFLSNRSRSFSLAALPLPMICAGRAGGQHVSRPADRRMHGLGHLAKLFVLALQLLDCQVLRRQRLRHAT